MRYFRNPTKPKMLKKKTFDCLSTIYIKMTKLENRKMCTNTINCTKVIGAKLDAQKRIKKCNGNSKDFIAPAHTKARPPE